MSIVHLGPKTVLHFILNINFFLFDHSHEYIRPTRSTTYFFWIFYCPLPTFTLHFHHTSQQSFSTEKKVIVFGSAEIKPWWFLTKLDILSNILKILEIFVKFPKVLRNSGKIKKCLRFQAFFWNITASEYAAVK